MDGYRRMRSQGDVHQMRGTLEICLERQDLHDVQTRAATGLHDQVKAGSRQLPLLALRTSPVSSCHSLHALNWPSVNVYRFMGDYTARLSSEQFADLKVWQCACNALPEIGPPVLHGQQHPCTWSCMSDVSMQLCHTRLMTVALTEAHHCIHVLYRTEPTEESCTIYQTLKATLMMPSTLLNSSQCGTLPGQCCCSPAMLTVGAAVTWPQHTSNGTSPW
jgi:hypothetical protein